MAVTALPSPNELRKLLDYDPETGILTWRHRPREMFPIRRLHLTWNTRFAGKVAFTAFTGDGYLHGAIYGRKVKAHRVAYAIYHGEWPDMIDHINGVRDDNRIANLRNVDNQTNLRNTKRRKDNTTGVTGVHWFKATGCWTAIIGTEHIGYFKTFAEACEARWAAEIERGYHPNHGRAA